MVSDPLPHALESDFYNRDTVTVAKELVGCLLWRKQESSWRSWRIVETEAYTENDPACHAYQRKKGRAAMLYAEPGTAYVYLSYGMHYCINAVTEPLDTAGAVLIRALEPIPPTLPVPADILIRNLSRETAGESPADGGGDSITVKIESPIITKPKQTANILRTDGPGRLTRALGITQELFNGKMLTEPTHGLYISAGEALYPDKIITTTRIGITKGVDFPWRFYELENPWVSVRNKAAEAEQS